MGAKNELYNGRNNDFNDDKYASNRFTVVDNNFEEDKIIHGAIFTLNVGLII